MGEHNDPEAPAQPAGARKPGATAPPSPAFKLRVSEDRLAVLLTCTAPEEEAKRDLLERRIRHELVTLGVSGRWDLQDLTQLLADHDVKDNQITDLPIVAGTPPVAPVDGRIEWQADFFSEGFLVDEATGAADYRRRAGKRTVNAGQLLARVSPCKEGTPGEDVAGKPIRVRKPRRPAIRIRRNVREEEQEDGGLAYYTETDGRICWRSRLKGSDSAGGILSVDEVFTIEGSVDLESGDIAHPGAVVVLGDVKECATLEVGGDLEVRGMVEPSSITCGGNLTVNGGITGAEDYRLVVEGGVQAKFLLDAHIEAGGDVTVAREIVQCVVVTRGKVETPGGRIVGGSVTALGGVDVGFAGSDGDVATEIIVGVDYRLERDLAVKEEEKAALEKAVKKEQGVVAPLAPRLRRLPEEKRQAVVRLLDDIKAKQTVLETLDEEMAAMKAASREAAELRIRIRNRVYPETVLGVAKERRPMRSEFPGPALAWLSKGRVELRPSASGRDPDVRDPDG